MKKRTVMIGAAIIIVLILFGTILFFINQSVSNGTPIDSVSQHQKTPLHTNNLSAPSAITDTDISIAPTALGEIAITPLSTTTLGVATDSAFLISSDVITLTEDHLRSYLSVRSGEAFLLEPQSDNDFLLHFQEDLSNNQVFNFIYHPPERQAASYAFQTVDTFRVTATTPADNTHGIPHDTGIEVTFSQALIDQNDFIQAFTIDPHVNGRFELRDQTHIFIPESLEFNTVYTVTIQRGLTSATGDVLEESYMFSFTTQWGTAIASAISIAGNPYETFLPWDEVLIAINLRLDPTTREFQYLTNREFNVNVYDLQNPESFVGFDPATDNPTNLVTSMDIELYTIETEHHSFHYLFLEQTLPIGYYVAIIRGTLDHEEIVLHKFIQVSPLSVYSLSIEGETIFWLHDAVTGTPASGAGIIIDEDSTAMTDSQGIAIVETGQNSRAIITIEYGDYLPFAYTKPIFSRRPLLPTGRFLSYIYTDRPTYRPDDTVDIFGVIKPRYGQAHLPEDIFILRFGSILEFPITLDDHNSFNMRVPVNDMFGFMDIMVEVNGERLMSTWVDFRDYTNLSYILEGSFDKTAYFLHEQAQAEILVTTFAGLPIEGVTLLSDDLSLTTDSFGSATGDIPLSRPHWDHDNTHWEPHWTSFWFAVVSGIQASQGISMPLIIAPRDIMMEFEYTGGDTAVITTNTIVIDALNSPDPALSPWSTIDADLYRGAAVDVDFIVSITQHVTTRTIRSQHYDRINRRTVTTYDFYTTSTTYRMMSGRTENGRAVITDLPYSQDPFIRYTIEVQYNDSRGRGTVIRLIDQTWRNFWQESAIRHFGLILENRNLKVNQSTNVSLVESPNPWVDGWWDPDLTYTPLTEGRMLAILVRDGVLSATAGSPQGVSVTFPEEAISSVLIFGAYFDGQYIFSVSNPVSVIYDFSERELQIDLDFDKDDYTPGEEVTITIQTTDASGLPTPAQVMISVVDESSMLHPWHQADFLRRLYLSSMLEIWTFRYFQFTSHIQHNFGGSGFGAEGGGNGDAGFDGTFRQFFVDNPTFELVQTDSSGVGTLTLTLPDQITSWRVTALGLTEDGLAGDSRSNITSSLPFYVDLLLTNEYIVGDDVAALVRVFGVDRRNTANINFTFEVLQNGSVIFTDTITSTSNVTFNAGKLDAGSYIMRVSATMDTSSGTYSDGVELPFDVVESGMILPVRVARQISEESPAFGEFSMRSLPVHVTLTNGNIRPLMNILNDAWDSRSYRTDYIAAGAYISHFYNTIFGHTDPDYDFTARVRSRIHGESGGIPQLTYELEDFYYTARFAASFPEFVNRQRLIRYIQWEMEDAYPKKQAAGLLALAGIGEPVLLQTHDKLHNFSFDNHYDRLATLLYLTAALVALGDYTGASNMVEQYSINTWDISQFTVTQRETLSTLLLFINTALNPRLAWEYINRPTPNIHVSNVAERINFVRRAYILGETYSEVQYFLNGTTHTVRLENLDRLVLQLSQDQFDSLNLIPTNGVTDLHIEFYDYGADNWDLAGNRVQIERSLVRDGDLIRVDLRVTLPPGDGFYTIYDRLPSNLRFVPSHRTRQDGPWFFVHNTQRQLVEISFSSRDELGLNRRFSYYAVELFEADMAMGTTYISNGHMQEHVWGTTR